MDNKKLFVLSFVIGLTAFTICAIGLYLGFGKYFHIFEELVGI